MQTGGEGYPEEKPGDTHSIPGRKKLKKKESRNRVPKGGKPTDNGLKKDNREAPMVEVEKPGGGEPQSCGPALEDTMVENSEYRPGPKKGGGRHDEIGKKKGTRSTALDHVR